MATDDRQEPGLTGEGLWSDTPLRPVTHKQVPVGGHRLPPLPYPYNALEPHIDEETMRLHHDKHHQSYVDGLNKAERMMAEARRRATTAVETLGSAKRPSMARATISIPFSGVSWGRTAAATQRELLAQIRRDFGSFA